MRSTCIQIVCLSLLVTHLAAAQEGGPTVEVALSSGSPSTETPFQVAYTLTWPQGETVYVLMPVALPELGWGVWRLLRHTSLPAGESGQRIEAVTEITPSDAGTHEIPGLNFAYVADGAVLEAATPSLVAAPAQAVTVRGAAAGLPIPLLAAGSAALVVLLSVAVLMLRRGRRDETGPARSPEERVQYALHAAQRHRLDGDFYGYYQELTRIAEWTAAENAELVSALRTRTQSVGYRGVRPTEDELNGDQRAIERAVADWKEERVT